MDFREATDRLMEVGVTMKELAQEIGCSRDAVDRARMNPESEHYRNPPPGWREATAAIARRRGGELCEFADEVELEN